MPVRLAGRLLGLQLHPGPGGLPTATGANPTRLGGDIATDTDPSDTETVRTLRGVPVELRGTSGPAVRFPRPGCRECPLLLAWQQVEPYLTAGQAALVVHPVITIT